MAKKKQLPAKIMGVPTPVVIVVGVAGVAFLYLRNSAVAEGVQAAGVPDGGGGGGGGFYGGGGRRGGRGPAGKRGPTGRRGKRGPKGRIIRKVLLICPPGYHKGPGGKHCIPNKRRPRHPAHRLIG